MGGQLTCYYCGRHLSVEDVKDVTGPDRCPSCKSPVAGG